MPVTADRDALNQARRCLDAILSATSEGIDAIHRGLRAALAGEEPAEALDTHTELGADRHARVGIHDIERHARLWMDSVPADPVVRAAVAHELSDRFSFAREDVPALRAALGLDRPVVRQAYQTLFDAELPRIYAERTLPDDRPLWFRIAGLTTPEMMEDLSSLLTWVTLTSGDTLCREGELGDSMYAVVSGRLRVVTYDEDGKETILAERASGAIIGELAVLTDDRHRTATIYATRDSELIELSRESFEALSTRWPALALMVTREIITLMRGALTGELPRGDLTNLAIVPANPEVRVDRFVQALEPALANRSSVLVLDRARVNRLLGSEIADIAPDHPRSSDLARWLNQIEERYRFVLFVADPELSEWTRRCLRMADRVWLVAGADSSPEPGPIERFLQDIETRRPTASRELVLLHPSPTRRPDDTQSWLEGRRVLRHHHICLDEPGACDALARFADRRAVGLVLSGGAARGLAHVGVVRALHEADIPIDAVAGTSFGAIVAGAIALGWDWQRISDVLHEFSANNRRYFRLALPLVSVMEGGRLDELFRTYYGDVRIEDLWTSFFCIASNLSRSRAETLERGPLWRAVRASMAIPSVFPPVIEHDELLVDGGVMNNLPADVMKQKLEGGTVISSNVGSIESTPARYRFEEGVSSWRLAFDRLLHRDRAPQIPSILEVATKTMTLSSQWAVSAQVASSDLLIECPVSQYSMFDYDAIDRLIELGYQAATEALDGWSPPARA